VDNSYFPPQSTPVGNESWPKYSAYFLTTSFEAPFIKETSSISLKFSFKNIGMYQTIYLKTFFLNYIRYGLKTVCVKYGKDYIKPCYSRYETSYSPTLSRETTVTIELRSDIDPKIKLFQLTSGTYQFETPKFTYIIFGVLFTITTLVCCLCLLIGFGFVFIVLSILFFFIFKEMKEQRNY
jgi:hypothetical protein